MSPESMRRETRPGKTASPAAHRLSHSPAQTQTPGSVHIIFYDDDPPISKSCIAERSTAKSLMHETSRQPHAPEPTRQIDPLSFSHSLGGGSA